jgi:hypothetical protein
MSTDSTRWFANGQRSGAIVLLTVFFTATFVVGVQPSAAAGTVVQQQVYLNIPAYSLSLYTQYEDGQWERLTVPVAVGKGPDRRYQTPTGWGELYAKANGVTFYYGTQNPAELVGKRITHSNTFDKTTLEPVTIKMPNDMKSIFMRLNSDLDGQFYQRFVLHETTDWYTVGTPASKGCVRIDRADMQKLYHAIVPAVSDGNFAEPIPITVYYDVAEYVPEQKMVLLHANVYNRPVDYVQEILRDLQKADIDTTLMNMPALVKIVEQAQRQFEQALSTIRARLRKAPFERFIHGHEKQLLHFRFYLIFRY